MIDGQRSLGLNLKAVVQETGLAPDTLRAWERRYGIPRPERSGGGQRLYSRHDVEVLKWLVARRAEGWSISRAVAEWQRRESSGLPEAPPWLAPAVDFERALTLDELRERWVEASLAFDRAGAEAALAQAFALYPPAAVCGAILDGGLAKIGELWYADRATVHQEHFASALAVREVDHLLAVAPPPIHPERIVVGCPEGEEHTFGPLLLTLLLRWRGWDVLFLGANVPAEWLDRTCAQVKPALVIFSAARLSAAARLLDAARRLDRLGVRFAFGGPAFDLHPELRERIPGHFLGETLSGAVAEAERLIQTARPNPPARQPASPEAGAALRAFQARRLEIDAAVRRRAETIGLTPSALEAGLINLDETLEAALALDDAAALDRTARWLRPWLERHGISPAALDQSLRLYRAAVADVLGPSGDLILAWLDRVMGG